MGSDGIDLGGLKIGLDVGTAETVDGLFWVADVVEVVIALPEKGIQNIILNGVGILEFVDEDGVVESTQIGLDS